MRVFSCSSLYIAVFRSFTKRSVQMKIDLNQMDNINVFPMKSFVTLINASSNKKGLILHDTSANRKHTHLAIEEAKREKGARAMGGKRRIQIQMHLSYNQSLH